MHKPDRPHTLALMDAIAANDLEAFEREQPLANIRGQNNGPLRTALGCGNLAMAEIVFQRAGTPSNDIYLLMEAVRYNQLEAAQWICEKLTFKKNAKAVQTAALYGSFECLQWLLTLPQTHPKLNSSKALQNAIIENHPSCIELLLPHSNPKANFSLALQNAVHYNRAVVPMLIEVCSVEDALHAMENSREPNADDIEYLRSFHTNAILTKAVQDNQPAAPSRKKM